MAGQEDWALEGRRISRKAYAQRDPVLSSEVALPLQASSEDVAERKFNAYTRVLGLTDKDLKEGKSICVIGAGDNAFAAGVKRRYPDGKHAFVMGVDPAEKRYHQLDPAIINHDARELGFPSDFEGFDLVVSVHAVPKYLLMWGIRQENRDEVINRGSDMFDYTVADREASNEEIEQALYEAFSEMLRITKPGGMMKMYPFPVSGVIPSMDEFLVQQTIERLSIEYPGIEAHLIVDDEVIRSAGPRDRILATLEISRPLVKPSTS
mgnify:CR=1 FL=1